MCALQVAASFVTCCCCLVRRQAAWAATTSIDHFAATLDVNTAKNVSGSNLTCIVCEALLFWFSRRCGRGQQWHFCVQPLNIREHKQTRSNEIALRRRHCCTYIHTKCVVGIWTLGGGRALQSIPCIMDSILDTKRAGEFALAMVIRDRRDNSVSMDHNKLCRFIK